MLSNISLTPSMFFNFLFLFAFLALGRSQDVTWKLVTPESSLPLERQQHSASLVSLADENLIVVFGGVHSWIPPGVILNDIVIYHIEKNVWTFPEVKGEKPDPRREHSSVVSSKKEIYIFGGEAFPSDEPTFKSNELFKYSLESNTWEKLNPSGSLPPGRFSHAMAISKDDDIFLFGGQMNTGFLADLWKYSISKNTWTQLKPTGDLPAGRIASTLVYDSLGSLYLFGGIEYFGSYEGYLNDMHKLTIATNKWEELDTQYDPSQRASHTSNWIKGKMIMACGYDTIYLNDIHIFDPASLVWETTGQNQGDQPNGLTAHASVPFGNQLFVFGGNTGGITSENKLYRIQLPL